MDAFLFLMVFPKSEISPGPRKKISGKLFFLRFSEKSSKIKMRPSDGLHIERVTGITPRVLKFGSRMFYFYIEQTIKNTNSVI